MLLSRAKASIEARLVQPWKMRYFDKTKSGKILRSYKDKYKGRRCFFIGNGPSLTASDLTKLHNSGEITFAFNRVYNIFDSTPWRPDFYISQDEKMLIGCVNEVDKLDLPVKFIPVNMAWYHGIKISNVSWFMMKAPKEDNYKPLEFSDEIDRQIYQAKTGMYTAAQLAAYMGFSEIYLIGTDHHFRTSINSSGQVVVDNTVKDYFSEKYNEDKEALYIPNTDASTLTYAAMKEQCEKRGIKVFNATRGGKLEVFQRVNFGSLFESE